MSSLIHSEPRYANLDSNSPGPLRARLMALELMVELLLTDRMSRVPNPVDETLAFKREVLGLVAVPDPDLREEDRRLHDMAVAFLDERLNAVVSRVAFDDTPVQSKANTAIG